VQKKERALEEKKKLNAKRGAFAVTKNTRVCSRCEKKTFTRKHPRASADEKH